MRWQEGRASENVEDRRFVTPGRAAAGVGGLGIIIAILMSLLSGNPQPLIEAQKQAARQAAGGGGAGGGAPAPGQPDPQAEQKEFVTRVLGTTEDVFNDLFAKQGLKYEEPNLVLFTGLVESACGRADASVGPFYCPGDRKVYIDLAFYDELRDKFGAPGDFAQAYVVAHEVGHHVQNLLGLSEKVQMAQRRAASKSEANELSVRLELQADYLAGVWAHHAQNKLALLEKGDIKEGLNAATQIGDDTLQRKAQGRVVPDSFTHGSSEQRVRWFAKGLASGDLNGSGALFELPYNQL
jgi:predicted metalloprotease